MNRVEIKGTAMLDVRVRRRGDNSVDYASIQINGEDLDSFLGARLSEGIKFDADDDKSTTIESAAVIHFLIMPAAPLDIKVVKQSIPAE